LEAGKDLYKIGQLFCLGVDPVEEFWQRLFFDEIRCSVMNKSILFFYFVPMVFIALKKKPKFSYGVDFYCRNGITNLAVYQTYKCL